METAGQGSPIQMNKAWICMTKSYQIKAWDWIFIPFVKLFSQNTENEINFSLLGGTFGY